MNSVCSDFFFFYQCDVKANYIVLSEEKDVQHVDALFHDNNKKKKNVACRRPFIEYRQQTEQTSNTALLSRDEIINDSFHCFITY